MGYVLGIDKGTSMVKSVVFDATGRACGSAERRVEVLSPRPGWHEEDPEASWQACAATIRGALKAAGIDGAQVQGVGIAGHMGGAWVLDGQGRPLRNAICWPDERAASLLADLEGQGVLQDAFAISGNGLMPGITLLLLAWLSKHEPQVARDVAVVLSAKDYLRYRLTGALATDPSDVSFVPGDIRAQTHSAPLAAMLGAGAWSDRMPKVLPSEAVAGEVTAQAAEATGLKPGTPVVTGLGDAVANVIGVGRSGVGEAVTVLGTSCLNSQVLDGPASAPEGLGFLFAMPQGRYLRILPNTSGTITLDWFLDRFGGPKTDGAWDFAEMERRMASLPRGSGGVILMPYVNTAGVLAPFYDPRARGAFFGMTRQTTRDHLLRATYEALAFSTRDCFAAMEGQRERLTLTGGGARSAFWAQIFADVCGLPVETCAQDQSGAYGVALLAGVASGLWPDLDSAQATVTYPERYEPDPKAVAEYDDWFGLYQEVRETYRGFSRQRSSLLQAVGA